MRTNLIIDPWIPVLRRQGSPACIAPHQLTESLEDNPVVALAPVRPDFKGALFQFLSALLQCTLQPTSEKEWGESLLHPPEPEALARGWADWAPYFELGGEGPRFMQDLSPLPSRRTVRIASLLIDAPGENTIKLNIDHFIKADAVRGLCPACAAQALLTLQVNAPPGGAGHRTSLRGGGPLTTLLLPDPNASILPYPDALWTQLWLNVLTKSEWPAPCQGSRPPEWLPWAFPTRTSERNELVTPGDVHPFTALWGTPRRIRLDLDHLESGDCDLCGRPTDALITSFTTRPRGANYVGWVHPYSPYRRSKPDEPWLPVHPQPGGLGYRHWPTWVAASESSRPALVVDVQSRQGSMRSTLAKRSQLRLWAFGYELKDAKARSYQETTMPLLDIDNQEHRKALEDCARALVDGAGSARSSLRGTLKDAWFGTRAEVKGDFGFVEAEFWDRTQNRFFELLKSFAEDLEAGGEATVLVQPLALVWQRKLRDVALDLFDQWVLGGDHAMGNLKRMAEARSRLRSYLGSAKFLALLGGTPPAKPDKPCSRKGVHP